MAALDWLTAFVERRVATPEQAGLWRLVVEEGRRQAALLPLGLPAAELSLAVYAAASGAEGRPLPLAGSCLCVYLGADLLDNVIDRELSARWIAAGPNQAILTGVTFLTPLAVTALSELDVPATQRALVQDALTDALLAMAAGQSADVAFEGRGDVTLADCEAMVYAKSGVEFGCFARLGALLAGASPASCEAYATFGRELGTTAQLISDCADLTEGAEGKDLATGKRTLPVVYALSTLPEPDRTDLLGHLAAAPREPARKHAARETLVAAGGLQFGALTAEVHRQRALTALRAAQPAGAAAKLLYDWVEDWRLGHPSTPS